MKKKMDGGKDIMHHDPVTFQEVKEKLNWKNCKECDHVGKEILCIICLPSEKGGSQFEQI